VYADTVTGPNRISRESVGHSAEELGWEEGEEVVLDKES
jgi:hypothetical protein